MDNAESTETVFTEEAMPRSDAPSPRAQALRDELFGSALTVDEVAHVLGLDRTTVGKYLRENVLYGFQIGREWLVSEEELRAYVTRLSAKQFRIDDDRFAKFTDRAMSAFALANDEARRFHHNYLGTEHLLLGLIRNTDGVAGRALANLGAELDAARLRLTLIIGHGSGTPGEPKMTPRLSKVVDLAINEALELRHNYLGTEHLLLGLLREGEGIAAGILESLGFPLEKVHEGLMLILTQTLPKSTTETDQVTHTLRLPKEMYAALWTRGMQEKRMVDDLIRGAIAGIIEPVRESPRLQGLAESMSEEETPANS